MSPSAACYAVHGVVLACERPLSLLAACDPAATPTLRVSWESSDAAPPRGEPIAATAHGVEGLHVLRTGAGYLLRLPGVGDYAIDRDARRIVCRPAPGAAGRDVEQVLIDQVLPRALERHGRLCLHASAVELRPGMACAFVGETGMGKSTLAAALAQRGAALLSDDALCLELTAVGVRTAAGNQHARLLADAANHLGAHDIAPRNDKRWLPQAHRPGALGLDAIFSIDRGALAIEPMTPALAVAELSRHVLRLDPTDGERLQQELDALVALSARTRVAFLRYPRRFDAIAQVEARLYAALTPA